MLEARDLKKSYGSRTLFEGANFTVGPGERVGVLGRNGSGKTTLFRIISGIEHPDAGTVSVPSAYRLGTLSQHIKFAGKTVLEEATADMPLLEGGYKEDHRAEAMLSGLGFEENVFSISPNQLSGGFQVRLQLAKLLLSEPNLLLLDEPTNYLDIVSARWISSFLRGWSGELMVISHDRGFLDGVVTHILGIHRGKLRKMRGSSREFEEQIEQEELQHEQTRVNQERKNAQVERFIERFRAKASKASAVQSRIKALERSQKLIKLSNIEMLEFRFNAAPFAGRWMAHIENISFGFERSTPLIRDLKLAVRRGDRIGIVGKNGRGKTTLLRLLAGELKPDSGLVRITENVRLGYFGQTNIERLRSDYSVEQEVQEVDPAAGRSRILGLCGCMMFSGEDSAKKVRLLSGGERSRVMLAKILAQQTNLLLLDEPSNHLDLESTDALIDALKSFSGAALFVTHNEMMLKELAERLIVFDNGGCFVFEGGYDDFLERVGWSEDAATRRQKERNSAPGNRKEQRRQRAQEQRQRRELFGPLEREIAALEQSIVAAEEKIKREELRLAELAAGEYTQESADLAKSLSEGRSHIEELFEQLEQRSRELEIREKEL